MPFARPTTTATPDEIFEEWVHVLSHAELLALLYVVRRTLGFKKDQDSISYTQFLHGIVTREGKVLDRGCGIKSRGTLAAALRRLEERGLIRSVKTQTAAGDQATTRYTLWFVGDDARDAAANTAGEDAGEGGSQTEPGWFANRTTGSLQIEPRVVRQSNPQQTVETTNTKQQTVLSKRKGATRHTAPLDSTASMRVLTPTMTTGESPSPVAAAVADLSDEFGDDAPQASRTRVANMQRVAGLADADVLPLLDEAAAIARSQTATITKRGRGGEIVRMPYLLATLGELVDAPNVPDAPPASGAGRPDSRLSGTGPGLGAAIVPAPVPAPAQPALAGPCTPGVGATAAVAGDDPPADSAATALWRAVLGEVREVLTPENYAVWFAPACALALEGDVLRVAVPSPFHADWLAHKLRGRVQQALERTGHAGVRIVYASVEREMSPPTGTSGVPVSSPVAAVAAARPLGSAGRASDGDRPPAGDMSHLVGGCPLCRAAPCRCRPAERARRVGAARAGSPAVAGRGAP